MQDELRQLRMPVRMWANLKAMVAAGAQAAATSAAASAAADSVEARASRELAANTAAAIQSAAQQEGETAAPAAEQQLHPDIMQRRMPQNYVGTGRMQTTRVKVTGRNGWGEMYALQVRAYSLSCRRYCTVLHRV